MTGRCVCSSAMFGGLIFLLVTLFFTVQLDFEELSKQIVPDVCLVAMSAAAISEFVSARRQNSPMEWNGKALLSLPVFGLYLIGILALGFYIATPVFTALLFGLWSSGHKRSIVQGLIFGCVLVALIYWLFVNIMDGLLPEGMLFEAWAPISFQMTSNAYAYFC